MTGAGTVPATLVVLATGDVLVVETAVEVDDPLVTGDELMVVVGVVDGVGEDPPHEVTARRAAHTTYRPRVTTACGVDDMFGCHHPPG